MTTTCISPAKAAKLQSPPLDEARLYHIALTNITRIHGSTTQKTAAYLASIGWPPPYLEPIPQEPPR